MTLCDLPQGLRLRTSPPASDPVSHPRTRMTVICWESNAVSQLLPPRWDLREHTGDDISGAYRCRKSVQFVVSADVGCQGHEGGDQQAASPLSCHQGCGLRAPLPALPGQLWGRLQSQSLGPAVIVLDACPHLMPLNVF